MDTEPLAQQPDPFPLDLDEEDDEPIVKQEEQPDGLSHDDGDQPAEDRDEEQGEGDAPEPEVIGQDEETDRNDEPERADDEEEEEEDDEDDEDDVQISIGDYKPGSLSLTQTGPINININKKGPAAVTAAKTKAVAAVDLNAEGTINGESIYDVNIDSIEEKPWTKPGADITDYFNYGFCEETWKQYCLKQRKLRLEVAAEEQSGGGMHSGPNMGLKQSRGDYMPRNLDSIVNENSKYASGSQLKPLGAGPPPGRKPSGAIDVIGTQSGGIPSRRMDQNDYDNNPTKIQVLSRPPPIGPPPPFNMNMPPPHLMHPLDGGFIPRVPPPGMMPPNGQPMPFHPDFPPPRFMPPPPQEMRLMNDSPHRNYDDYEDGPDDGRDRDYYMRDRPPHWQPPPRGGYERGGYRNEENDFRRGPPPHAFDRREVDQRDYDIRDYKEQDRSERGMIRSDRDDSKEHESSSGRSRGSHRDRDRDRDHDSKSRDKDKESDRDKESSSSKRRHHDDDSKSSSSSSRHKHSKRSRRDKDEESSSKH